MSYTRVLPRDLFNESKLLKCLGQLSLLIHEGKGIRWPLELRHTDYPCEGFDIEQNQDDGGLFCRNLWLYVGESPVRLYSAYNSKYPYPLYFECGDESGAVFKDNGQLHADFTVWLDCLQGAAT